MLTFTSATSHGRIADEDGGTAEATRRAAGDTRTIKGNRKTGTNASQVDARCAGGGGLGLHGG